MATGTASDPTARSFEHRVLVLPPTRADAAAIQQLLSARSIECEVVADMRALCWKVHEGAGSVLISEEAQTG